MADRKPLTEATLLSRRRALAWFGGLGLAALVPGCADDDAPEAGSPTTTTTATTTAGGTTSTETEASCVLSPELTEGPFYLDLDRVRSDITEGRPGLPLELDVNVVDVDACEPIKDAAVDIWHCDAEGTYSGVSGDPGTFLRGIQMTDADGAAGFRTIYPGWYTGRAVHIHVKVHLGATETYTGQLFFEDDVTAAAYQNEPYSARPEPDTLNSDDGIFGQSGGTTIVAVTPSSSSYAGEVTLGVQRT
jgi:protocatechuate 3,4-dioxygenase beta subunit